MKNGGGILRNLKAYGIAEGKAFLAGFQLGFSTRFKPSIFRQNSKKWLKPYREARLKPAFNVSMIQHPPPEGGGKEEPAEAG